LELRHLRYFVAVAEELSFTRASERLHIAQPPLSQQIRQLEEEVGAILLARGERPLKLTEAGKLMLVRAKAILSAVDIAAKDVGRVGRGYTGHLNVAFAGSGMFSVVPGLIKAFGDIRPDVELQLTEMLAAEIVEGLRAGSVDVAFARPPLNSPSEFDERILVSEPFFVAMPDSHRLASRAFVELEDLRDEALILYPRYPLPSVTELVIGACMDAGFEPVRIVEARHMQTAIGLVASGVGLTLIAESVAVQKRNNVSFVRLQASIRADLSVVWRKETPDAPLAAFLALIDREIQK
jgi:LysR family transcriptional regulator, benzoate and cis,cis-muconate-responsive activator of ben and cat genes